MEGQWWRKLGTTESLLSQEVTEVTGSSLLCPRTQNQVGLGTPTLVCSVVLSLPPNCQVLQTPLSWWCRGHPGGTSKERRDLRWGTDTDQKGQHRNESKYYADLFPNIDQRQVTWLGRCQSLQIHGKQMRCLPPESGGKRFYLIHQQWVIVSSHDCPHCSVQSTHPLLSLTLARRARRGTLSVPGQKPLPLCSFCYFSRENKYLSGIPILSADLVVAYLALDCPRHFCSPTLLSWESLSFYICVLFLLYSGLPALSVLVSPDPS